MPPTVTHLTLVRAARKEIKALRNPGIRPDAWSSMVDLLHAIAGYLPECFPSERTLAKKLGRHQQNVHRTLARARELGLVVTTVRPLEKSYRDGQSYHLMCLSEALRATITRHRFQTSLDVRSSSSSSKKNSTDPPLRGGSSRPRQEGSNLVPLNRFNESDEWSSPPIGKDPEPELPVIAVKQIDPAVSLWASFTKKWARLQRRQPGLVIIRRGPSGRGIGYLRRWIEDEGYSPEHIEAYMDEFIEAVSAGEVVIKERQFAWQALTAWWGTTDVEDPAIDVAAKAKAADAVAAARAYWAEQDRLTGG